MDKKSHLYTVIAMSFLFAGGFTAVSPVLPDVMEAFLIPATQAGLMLSVFAGGRMVFSILGGIIADRVRVGRVIASASAIGILGSIIAIMTSDFNVLLIGRALQGIGTATYMVAATGYIIDKAPPNKLAVMLAWNQSTLLVGMSLGPALGGASAAIWGYRGPFVLFAAYGVIGLATSYFFLRGTEATVGSAQAKRPVRGGAGSAATAPDDMEDSSPPEAGGAVRSGDGPLWSLIRNPLFLLVLGVSLIVASLRAGLRSTVIPLYAAELLDFNAQELGLLLTVAGVANLAVMYPIAKSIEVLGWRRVMTFSLPLGAIPIAAFLVIDVPWQFYVAISFLTMLSGFSGVVSGNAIAELAHPRVQKTAVGIDRTVRDFAFMASPVMMTYLAERSGYPSVFVGTTIVVAIYGLVLMAVVDWRRTPERA